MYPVWSSLMRGLTFLSIVYIIVSTFSVLVLFGTNENVIL